MGLENTNGVTLVFGNGDGFADTDFLLVPPAQGTDEVEFADFNGDTNIDIIAGDLTNRNVYVMLGDGTGNFADPDHDVHDRGPAGYRGVELRQRR